MSVWVSRDVLPLTNLDSPVATAADALLTRAQSQAACATPGVILNELLGAATPTPWSANTTQYGRTFWG